MSLGFSNVGFRSVWANDFNVAATKTYGDRFGDHCVTGDIVKILADSSMSLPKADVVIGGPPCQGFSLLNKGKDGDPRRHLWIPFLTVVELSGASVFVMENVPQLIGTPEHVEIVATSEAMGFRVTHAKLLAADFGVAQTRTRAFIVGCKFTDPTEYFPPKRTHVPPNMRYDPNTCIPTPRLWLTVRDAIGNLEPPSGTEIGSEPPLDLHFGRNPTELSLARYKAIPIEGMNREDLLLNAPELTPQCWINKKGGTDLFGRLWWDRPAFTIRTEFFKPEKGRYLHPEQHRPITHREAARFQSFPDDFKFFGTKIEIAKQIGNAVPPMLAQAVATSVKNLLNVRNHL